MEDVLFQQVEDRDLPLLLLVAGDRGEGLLVQLDRLQAVALLRIVDHAFVAELYCNPGAGVIPPQRSKAADTKKRPEREAPGVYVPRR